MASQQVLKTRLRPITEADQPLLYAVYASTRAAEMAMVPWSDEQKNAFIDMQFHAQHTYYQQHYPEAQFAVIELASGAAVGRLYVDRRPSDIRVIDIALLPEYRGQGIGSLYMKRLIAEAEGRSATVSIHVERNNPALRLYQRLGFKQIADQGVYLLLERQPRLSSTLASPT